MKTLMKISVVVASLLLLSACNTLTAALLNTGPESALFSDGRVNPAGANQIFPASIEGVQTNYDLAKLILGGDMTNTGCTTLTKPVLNNDTNANRDSGGETSVIGDADLAWLTFASACFEKKVTDADERKMRRNEIQSLLFAGSDQRCNLYITYIERQDTAVRGTSGVLTTVFGGIGALVAGPSSQIWSGLAAMSSGVGTELQNATLKSMTVSILIPAIRSSRTTFRTEDTVRRNRSYTEYPMFAAIDDVIEYHGMCNISNALSNVQQVANGVGLIQAKATLDKISSLRHALNMPSLEPATEDQIKKGAVFLNTKNEMIDIVDVGSDQNVKYKVWEDGKWSSKEYDIKKSAMLPMLSGLVVAAH